MKKIQLPKRKKQQVSEEKPARITNETVAEHREQVLAGGRRFKYPHQIARHKLVLNAILISLATLVLFLIGGWWQLYITQNTSNFFYRVTRIVPVPVASVDGQPVLFSDYLMTLSGSKHYLEQSERLDLSSEDGKRQIEYMKGQALQGAIADAYAAKLAKEEGVTVSNEEINKVIDSSLNTVSGKISEDVYNDSTFSTLGYTPDEYRHIIERSLLRQKVAYAIDAKATEAKAAAEKILQKKPDTKLSDLGNQLKAAGFEVQVASSGLVPKTNHDGGLTQAALQLQPGKKSQFIQSTTGDGYYIVQLVNKNSTQLSYNFLKIPLKEFDAQLQRLEKQDKIKTYIDVDRNASVTKQ